MDNLVFLPKITDKSLSIEKVSLHWVTPDESIVNKGDVLMEVITNFGNTYTVTAHMPGVFMRFWEEDLTIEKTKYQEKEFKIADVPQVCIGGLYESYEEFISSFFKYKAKVAVDSFTNDKTINWVYVAEPIINFPFITGKSYGSFNLLKLSKNNLNRRDVGVGTAAFRKVINISDYFSKGISLNFVFSEGNSYR